MFADDTVICSESREQEEECVEVEVHTVEETGSQKKQDTI